MSLILGIALVAASIALLIRGMPRANRPQPRILQRAGMAETLVLLLITLLVGGSALIIREFTG